MSNIGDIVQIYGSTAGHKKYHLCVAEADQHDVCKYLFINSHDGWEGDLVLADTEISCLPDSPTGQSVICCNSIIKYNAHQRTIFQATKKGELSKDVAQKLLSHIPTCKALSRAEKELVTNAITTLI